MRRKERGQFHRKYRLRKVENPHEPVYPLQITPHSIPPLQNNLHLPVTGNAALILVYLNDQMRQPFIFQLLGAYCSAEPFIIPGPTDARCGAELVHRPMIRFMQFLDGLIGRLMTHSA